MSYYLGIDIGTTATKSVLIDGKGKVISSISSGHKLITPKPNWAEQDPEDWYRAVKITIRKILSESEIEPENIKGVGLSGQMHGSVFLDKDNNVIRPAILWCDQRTKNECSYIKEVIGKEKIIEITKNPVLAGFTLPKIIWLKNKEPENFENVKMVLLPKDYIRFRLTGEFATEVSDASGTVMFDVAERKWSKEIIEKIGLDFEYIPECFESEVVSGRVNNIGAKETGLKSGTPIVGGAGDNAAGALGSGIVEPGLIFSTIGTSGVVFAYSNEPVADKFNRLHTFCHAVKGKWHVMGVMLSAGGSLRWFHDNIAQDLVKEAEEKRADSYDWILRKCQDIPPGAEGLFFLPYLSGERTPYPDPDAKGVFIGLSLKHTKDHMAKAVIEGITFGMRDSLELIKKMGIKTNQIRISGGGSKNRYWRQLQANIYGQPVNMVNADEGPAYGVALLAAVGTGCYNSIEEACNNTIKITETLNPKQDEIEKYNKLYKFYNSLYPILEPKFKEISNLI